MSAWWSGTAASFTATEPRTMLDHLSHEAIRRFRVNEFAQIRAWDLSLAILREALGSLADPGRWHVLIEFGIVRLGIRADAVLVCARGVVVLEFKVGATAFDNAARRQVEDYAIDLQDFHAASRNRPIVPVLVATDARAPLPVAPLLLGGVTTVLDATPATLGPLLRRLDETLPDAADPIDPAAWEHAAYQPVPGIIDAARHLFSRHDVQDLAAARADATNLTLTIGSIERTLAHARAAGERVVVFVTGIPGAGKTLCGLAVTFARHDADPDRSAAFLTGNPTLVHVLRDALVRDAVHGGLRRDAAKQRMEGFIQELPRFRDAHAADADPPPERIVVVDEAQRSWTEAQAVSKTRDRPVPLDRSEPALLLDIMARHPGFAALVCLVGNGQEIHDGEGGLAEWGEALAARPFWRVAASPSAFADPRPRSRLPDLRGARLDPSLHLTVPVRSVRHDGATDWVDAVLGGDAAAARAVAGRDGPELPFRLTRDLDALRAALRHATLDGQRAGLVASAGARRLRAEGLGAELPHMDADAVARWFLDSWMRDRDVRASDALETVATQFSIQGLELDHVGLAWDADLIRTGAGWAARRFKGCAWQTTRQPERIDNCLNAYRVLLTRARYGTIIFVPRGDGRDPTRPPAVYDAIAAFLLECGARPVTAVAAPPPTERPAMLL